ncbi:MAG: hypothetical protein IT521_04725 [Burkholderiales bacterium]|nr:hypothetical protein [Burkholderiales bacterium]
MPTARELLEQADALMRRNRSTALDDIPVLTDSVSPAPAPAPAPSAGRHVSVPEFSRPLASDTREPDEDPIPTLTEPVDPSTSQITDSALHEGEPSDWLDFDAGEPSVTGDAPDSVAIVPPVAYRRGDDDELIQSAEHEEIEVTAPADEHFDAETEAEHLDAPMSTPSTAQHAPEERVQEGLPQEGPPKDALPQDALPQDALPQDEPSIDEPWSGAAFGRSTELGMPEFAAVPPPMFVTAPVSAAVTAEASPVADEQARWDAVAEEVRMQVLQRIDLFTDTGLREQLGRRLQPIVDRASADLVATINLHVGELLRGYVAEAIEREIENWRKNN